MKHYCHLGEDLYTSGVTIDVKALLLHWVGLLKVTPWYSVDDFHYGIPILIVGGHARNSFIHSFIRSFRRERRVEGVEWTRDEEWCENDGGARDVLSMASLDSPIPLSPTEEEVVISRPYHFHFTPLSTSPFINSSKAKGSYSSQLNFFLFSFHRHYLFYNSFFTFKYFFISSRSIFWDRKTPRPLHTLRKFLDI